MYSISMSKCWAAVVLVVGTVFSAELIFAQNLGDTKESAQVKAAAELLKAAQDRLNSVNKECREAKEKAQKEKSVAIVACKDSKKQAQKVSPDNISESKKTIETCSKEFDECLDEGKDELDSGSILSNLQGYTGNNAMSALMPDLAGTAKRCSDLNKADYKAALEKEESALDTKNEKLEKIQDSALKAQQEDQENYEKKQKEFLEAQEKKDKADLENKENLRNQEAAYDKQRAEYKAKADQIQLEIFTLQQQQSLLLRSKGEEVDAFNLEVIGCKEKATEVRSKQQKVSSGLITAQVSDAGKVWKICIANAARKRQQAQEVYNGKARQLDISLQMKLRDLDAINESATKLASMYQQAKSDQQYQKDKDAQSFLEKQKQAWLSMQNQVKNMQDKNFKNQQLLETANRQINIASKRVDDLRSQTPISSKSAEEIGQSISNFSSLIETADKICSQDVESVKATVKAAQDAYDAVKGSK